MTAKRKPGSMTLLRAERPVKVLMLCTGVGRLNRGIETFFSEAFTRFVSEPQLDVSMVIGDGPLAYRQLKALSLSRQGRLTQLVGQILKREAYAVEQMTSIPSILLTIAATRPDVIFTSEANLAPRLMSLRRLLGLSFRILYSNGAPLRGPFTWADYVHQVTPTYMNVALEAGDDADRHLLAPYGFNVPEHSPERSLETRRQARAKLGLPLQGQHVLSAGWISKKHKRMDYIVDEVANHPGPRPHLTLIGAIDESSWGIMREANEKLGDGVTIRSVRPDEVQDYYRATDVFALGSLSEGFGRVYVEALGSGVPVLSHDYEVSRYVNGSEGIYGDFSREGALTAMLAGREDVFQIDPSGDVRRWRHARDNFGWAAVAPLYTEMFHRAATGAKRPDFRKSKVLSVTNSH